METQAIEHPSTLAEFLEGKLIPIQKPEYVTVL